MNIGKDAGMWVLCTTFQGGGTIDQVDGPYWTKDEAQDSADAARATAAELKRRDRYEVALLVMAEDDQ